MHVYVRSRGRTLSTQEWDWRCLATSFFLPLSSHFLNSVFLCVRGMQLAHRGR